MSLIVEDGTSMVDAESYISVSDADTYHSSIGVDIWNDMTLVEKEQALRRATLYMHGEYCDRWLGYPSTVTQALDWPRKNIVMYGNRPIPSTFIPRDVKNACAELALRAAAGELIDDTEAKVIEETIGPITTKWDPKLSQRKRYPAIDAVLKMYMSSNGNPMMATLVRV